MAELRQYQSDFINECAKKIALGKKRIIGQLPTGAGKTFCFSGITHRYTEKQQKKVLILVHRQELLNQACTSLQRFYGITAAPLTAEVKRLPNVMVYVAMVETANNRLKKNPDYFGNIGMLIVDEVHFGAHNKIYSYFPNSIIIGFTATPISSRKTEPLNLYFEDIVSGISIPELIRDGALCRNQTYRIKNVDRSELQIKNGEFDTEQMGKVFSTVKHVQNCFTTYKKYADGTKTIIFNCNIAHSKKVTETFQAFGVNCRHLDGEMPDEQRKAVLHWFRQTPDAVLCNVGVLTTGFDEPAISTVMVNRSTKSLPLWLQMTGRGGRIHPGKEVFTILDMGGNEKEHGDWNLHRDWRDIFFNPDKPRTGGSAPTKECIGCGVVIHLSQNICPHCGCNNRGKTEYDSVPVDMEIIKQQPFFFNVAEMVQTNGGVYDFQDVHKIKKAICSHVRFVWGYQEISASIARQIHNQYQQKIMDLCRITKTKYSRLIIDKSTEWMDAELMRVFSYQRSAFIK